MRQGQQNRRGRGRNHNHHQQRKGQNPLSRSYESNGPDVKLRGTPNHIAEKYLSLARDAHSSGDPVLAENYLQHAEHYNRIIMAYREQNLAQGGGDSITAGSGEFGEQVNASDAGLGVMDTEGTEDSPDERSMSRSGSVDIDRSHEGSASQYDTHGGQFRSQNQGQRGEFHDRRDRRDQRDHREGRDRSDRRDRQDHRYDRRDRDRRDRFDRYPPQNMSGEPRGDFSQSSQRRDRNGGDRLPQEVQEQPEFLRRSVRRTRPVEESGEPEAITTGGPAKDNLKR